MGDQRPPADSDEESQGFAFFITRIGRPGDPVRRRTDDVEKYIIGPVLDERGLKLERADKNPAPGRITDRIIQSIEDAQVVIADVTGHSANVYYELGIAHAFGKPVLHLVDDPETIPFDTSDQNHIIIGDTGQIGAREAEQAKNHFRQALSIVLEEGYVPRSPVTTARNFSDLARSDDPKDLGVAELKARLDRLEASGLQPARGAPTANYTWMHAGTEYNLLYRDGSSLAMILEVSLEQGLGRSEVEVRFLDAVKAYGHELGRELLIGLSDRLVEYYFRNTV